MPPDTHNACPRCQAASGPGLLECTRCGVVFAKWARRVSQPSPPLPSSVVSVEAEATAITDRLVWWGHAGVLGVLVWLTWGLASTPFGPAIMESFLHLPDLIFHEAGHVLFSPLGRFMMVLGGSLFQLLVPVVVAGAMLRERQTFGATVAVWWAGQNLLDVAPYAADARALSLVLLGGRTGAEVEGHDWEYILTSLDLLHLDRAIGLWMHDAGTLVMVAAIVAGGLVLLRRAPRGRPPTMHDRQPRAGGA